MRRVPPFCRDSANAQTSRRSVDLGKWKFVTRPSTTLNRYPGVMKRFTSRMPDARVPSESEKLSRTRTLVVPTAMIRRLSFLPHSECALLLRSIVLTPGASGALRHHRCESAGTFPGRHAALRGRIQRLSFLSRAINRLVK